MKTYEATVTRDGKWWMIAIPEIDGLTQARRLSEVDQMARELVAVTLDVPLSQIEIATSHVWVDDLPVDEVVVALNDLRKAAAEAEQRIALMSAHFASELASRGVPLRDIGTVLGVSHQRAHQLINHDADGTEDTDAGLATSSRS